MKNRKEEGLVVKLDKVICSDIATDMLATRMALEKFFKRSKKAALLELRLVV